MGTGIAMSMLNAGIPVVLLEQNQKVPIFLWNFFNICKANWEIMIDSSNIKSIDINL